MLQKPLPYLGSQRPGIPNGSLQLHWERGLLRVMELKV